MGSGGRVIAYTLLLSPNYIYCTSSSKLNFAISGHPYGFSNLSPFLPSSPLSFFLSCGDSPIFCGTESSVFS